jgi:hypothetical protein
MTQFEKLKQEISAMSLDDFIKLFIKRKDGVKEFVCSDIKHPKAHCTKTDDYSCTECLREYLKSEE